MDAKTKEYYIRVLKLSMKIVEAIAREYPDGRIKTNEVMAAMWEALDSMVKVGLEDNPREDYPQHLSKCLEQSYQKLMSNFKKYN